MAGSADMVVSVVLRARDQLTGAVGKARRALRRSLDGVRTAAGGAREAMGKDINQAVEAVADAVTGEYERLKEFGIKASSDGDQTTFSYTDSTGEQRAATVDKNNRKAIQSTLESIWNEKYGGAMDKLSGTWAGMISNLSDQWTRFANMIAEAGVFDFLKNKLEGVLATVNEMAKSGRLEALAKQISDGLVSAFKQAWHFGEQFVGTARNLWERSQPLRELIGSLADRFGRMNTAVAGVVTLLAAPIVAPILSLAAAFTSLGAALIANPIGAIIAGIAIAGYLIYRYWDQIAAVVGRAWEAIKNALGFDPLAVLRPLWDGLVGYVNGILAAIRKVISGDLSGILDLFVALNPVNILRPAFDAAYAYLADIDWAAAARIGWNGIKTVFSWSPLGLIRRGIRAAADYLSGVDWSALGAKLLSTLVDGIKGAAGAVKDAVTGALSKARNLLPFSDAKAGPLSDLTKSGRALPATFAEGVAGNSQALVGAVDRVMAAANESLTRPVRSAQIVPFRRPLPGGQAGQAPSAAPAQLIEHEREVRSERLVERERSTHSERVLERAAAPASASSLLGRSAPGNRGVTVQRVDFRPEIHINTGNNASPQDIGDEVDRRMSRWQGVDMWRQIQDLPEEAG